MQLNELIKQETVRDIIKRTHISKVLLDKLSSGEFDGLNKTQVMGTISIIEREYGVDMNESRDEAMEYFDNNIQDEKNRFMVEKAITKENNFLSKFFVSVIIVILVYSSWYFFSSYYRPVSNEIETKSEKSLLDIIIAGKDTLMDKVNGLTEKSSLIKVESQAEKNQTQEEVPEIKVTPIESVKEEKIDIQKSEVAEKSTTTISKTITESENIIAEDKNTTIETPTAIKREKITILPQKMMLFQLVNLDTKRELRFKRRDQYDIDLRKNGWLFSAENTVFAFIDNDIFEEYGGNGKIFFRLDQDGIHQLSEDEYKEALRG
jgi:hypothetical protein